MITLRMRWLTYSAMADLFPRTEHFPGLADTGLDVFLKDFQREAPWIMRFGTGVGAFVYCVAPLFTVGLPLPSFWLPTPLRDLHAQRFAASPMYFVRQSGFLLKMVAGLCWGKHSDVRAKIGLQPYPPDPGTWRTS